MSKKDKNRLKLKKNQGSAAQTRNMAPIIWSHELKCLWHRNLQDLLTFSVAPHTLRAPWHHPMLKFG